MKIGILIKLIAIAFPLLTFIVQASAATEFYYTSSPESYIGGGETVSVTPAMGFAFIPTARSNNAFSFLINDNVSNPDRQAARNWSLSFAAPLGAPLAVGTYQGATRWPFQEASEPGLSLSGNGRGDNKLTGSFNVLEVSYAGDGSILTFAADFTQYDEGVPTWWNTGSIRYNSNIPVTITGTPDTTPPSVSFTDPLNNTMVNTATTTISGSASDNVGVAAVYVQVNSNAPVAASGTSSWTANVSLASGGNTVVVYSVDAAGNHSASISLAVTYSTGSGGGGDSATPWESVGFTKQLYGIFDANFWPWVNHVNFGWIYVYQEPANGGFWISPHNSKLKYAWISPSTMPRIYGYPIKASKLKVGWYSSRMQKGQRYILPPKSKTWIKDGPK